MSSSNKLHPIYVALENHQYNRAIKLCLAAQSSTLAQALLAHAYAKSGQRYKSLLTIQTIIMGHDNEYYFPELRLEIAYSLQRQEEAAAPTATATTKKSGKKGKKKGSTSKVVVATQQTAIITESSMIQQQQQEDWDLIDRLDTPPTLPVDWEKLPPLANAPTDETLLATMSMTMTTLLRLPLTAYQLYCWAASKADNDEFILRKAYLSGLAVLVAPQYQHHHHIVTCTILANMQVLALQLSRIQQQIYGISPATAWAAQTALWQVQYSSNDDDPQQQQRLAMLPRLAESLASKCMATTTSKDHLAVTQDFLLYMRTLEVQGKYEEQVQALNERLEMGGAQMAPPRQQILDLQITALIQMKRYDEARSVVEELLLEEYPDDWRYWKKHLECSLGSSETNNGGAGSLTREFIQTVITKEQERKYPLRGPHLMHVELARVRLLESSSLNEEGDLLRESVHVFLDSIRDYGKMFSARATCIFSDLSPYLETLLKVCNDDDARTLVQWASENRVEPSSDDPKEARAQLRTYIFSVQVLFKVLVKFTELQPSELPEWQELVRVWKDFERTNDTDQAQKESRPADELVLLAVQRLLYEDSDDFNSLLIAACLLESAIQCSPYNAYLKITLMLVSGELNAVSRAWELWKELQIKHIQHESCAYLIIPLLQSGGFYRETISVCQEILRLQTTAIRDATEFTGRALENGAMSKADEFIAFQRNRMNNSLTTLEAKGLVLDLASMFVQDEEKQDSLGAMHGIVGGEADVERASQMVAEAHNPCAAFSLLQLKGSVEDLIGKFSENRDFGIFSHEILIQRNFDSLEQLLKDSLRRGHHHRLLIRAALCVEAIKGPKKGKLTKSGSIQEKRCKSLLASVVDDEEKTVDGGGYMNILNAMHAMCCSIAVFGAGFYLEDAPSEDTLETREGRIADILNSASESLVVGREELGPSSNLAVSQVSRLLPDCIIPGYALFRMCAKAAELYGWGPRKQKTKICASAIARLASKLSLLVTDMTESLERMPDPRLSSEQSVPSEVSNLVDDEICNATVSNILRSQLLTRDRINNVLNGIKMGLGAFQEE